MTDDVGDLLAVGAHVLDGRGASQARNAGQTFYAGPLARHGTVDDALPWDPGAHIDDAVVAKVESVDRHVNDETVVAFVGND